VSREALQAAPAAGEAAPGALAAAAQAPPPGAERRPALAWAERFAAGALARGGEPAALARLREEAFAAFERLGFPTTRQEEWRFTNVGPIARAAFVAAPRRAIERAALAPWLFPGAPYLVVVDGVAAPELSDLGGLPAGVRFMGLAAALAAGDEAVAELGARASFAEQPFVALNTALFADGALVAVPAGVTIEQPLQVLFVSTGAAAEGVPAASFPRLLVHAGERATFTLVERYVSLGEGQAFTCPVTEVLAGASSVVDHYRLAQESAATWHVGLQQLWCDRAAALTSYSIVTGGGLVRQDVRAVLDGEGVDAILNGLYLTRGRQHVDHHMYVEHRKPHCDSHELYKGILEERSRAVFNGLIHVWPGAQKTDAKQTNRNLLLSSEALVNTNPQLRIFADDVKCTHGSTVGQLDEDAVFYLRSRGIGEDAAKSLLTYAFARDVVDRIKAAPVRHELEELLLARLPKGDVVRQAL
jgi:Fe-S cluster assembly protein SufD